jgi:5-methylcytosine-specific restriction endonuclease McrA
MPMDRSLYPDNWDDLATAVKEAVGWRCQECGRQCRRPGEPFDTHVRTLTVAHLDHNPANSDPSNLAALCSGCHLRQDAQHHARNAAATRRRRMEEAGQRRLEAGHAAP